MPSSPRCAPRAPTPWRPTTEAALDDAQASAAEAAAALAADAEAKAAKVKKQAKDAASD